MVQAILGPDYDLAKRLQKIERDVANLNTRDVLQNASIGAGGLTVDGGTINITSGGSLIVTGSGTIELATGTLVANIVNSNTVVTAGTDLNAVGNVNATNVNATNVNATGQVVSASALKSPGSKAYPVNHGYVVAYLDFDGTLGYTPSTADTKKDLSPMLDASALLSLTPYWGRYNWDAETDPLRIFLLAEEVQSAGFGPDVAPTDEAGKPYTINYPQLVVPLIALAKTQQGQIDSLRAQLTAQQVQIDSVLARLTAAGL